MDNKVTFIALVFTEVNEFIVSDDHGYLYRYKNNK